MLNFGLKPKNLVSLLQKKAIHSPDKTAYIFLADGEIETAHITYGELDKAARSIAANLQSRNLLGERVLLLFPAGLEFICAFLGCLYAGVISVSLNTQEPSEVEKIKELINTVVDDANITGILTTSSYIAATKKYIAESPSAHALFLMDTTNFHFDADYTYQPPKILADTVAFLQYTSGSTAKPKGTVICHQQLLYNLKSSAIAWHYTKSSITLTWTPHSHIYGLICGLLLPLYVGSVTILMSPQAFIRRPISWLAAITKYRVTHSGGPNFCYDVCVSDIREDAILDLNLTSWVVAINGGEMVQYETLQKFSQKFSRVGFQFNHFCSAYGMSELIGAIAVSRYKTKPLWFDLDIKNLQNHQVVAANPDTAYSRCVSSGYLLNGLQAIIVDPETLLPIGRGKIGEIWLTGKSLASGYWQNIIATKEAFQAQIPGKKKKYFRTGDLGFIKRGEIFLTGRLKELIIVHGKKYYPTDLEVTIATALRTLGVNHNHAAFSLEVNKKEAVFFIQEVKQEPLYYDEIINRIRSSILARYGIDVYAVILVKENSIPKTSSGKLQHAACQKQFLEKKLEVLKEYIAVTPATDFAEIKCNDIQDDIENTDVAELDSAVVYPCETPQEANADDQESQNTIESTSNLAQCFYPDFVQLVSSALNISSEKINLNSALSDYAVDSITVIKLASSLNDTYQIPITASNLFEYFTLAELFDDLLLKYQELLNSHYKIHTLSVTAHPIHTDLGDIAIIGMSGMFPNAADIETFWDNLISNKDAIREIPSDRWHWQDSSDDSSTTKTQKTPIKWGGFVDGMMEFDADFFSISPREAELIDPQQRIFLQAVWKTIEDAGYAVSHLSQLNTGVFVGVFGNDYAEVLHENDITDAYTTTSTAHSVLANRVSYLLNLHGPSMAIDTACSSSLVAVHHAVQAIQNGDCALAIAGGVNALLSPTSYIAANKAGMLSEDGQCKTFDKKANGYVRAEGVAAILLKPLSEAIRDGDHIYGVIKSTAVNHGGHVNSLTAPNPLAQAEVIVSAFRKGNIAVDSISYIETHGTGTPLGDPIEVNGLKKAFSTLAREQEKNIANGFCGLSSVKTHIGHLEAAAGMASLIKVLLTMQHEKIPGNLHFSALNPEIDLAESPFYIIDKTRSFPRLKNEQGQEIPRRVGISSFGFGGTNAHIIVEDYPSQALHDVALHTTLPYLITLSAKTTVALQQRIDDLHQWLMNDQTRTTSLAAISYTLNTGREHFNKRCVFVVNSLEDLKETLNKVKLGQTPENFILHTEASNKTVNQPIFQEFFKQLVKELSLGVQDFSSAEIHSKLLALGNFYVEGYAIEWEAFYPSSQKKRIALPTYPFAKQCYGVSLTAYVPPKINPTIVMPVQTAIQAIPDKETSFTEAIQKDLKQIIANLIKKPENAININASLSELGLDSITLKEFAIELEDYYNINLNPSLFFIHQTIEALSQYCLQNYPNEIKQIYNPTHLLSKPEISIIDTMPNENVSTKKNTESTIVAVNNLPSEPEPIAIIGMQGLFPQSNNVEEFWDHLQAGDDLITEIPIDRWDWHVYYGDTKQDNRKTNSKWGGFLTEVSAFDPSFFNISPREASLMDPRHRLLMEVVWKTIEDAGYDPTTLANEETGLFVGVERNEYQSLLLEKQKIFDIYATTGNADALLANRISYCLNLHGPSEVVNTACSSALVALNRAVSALRHGECSIAIVGGVSLILDPNTFIILSQLGVLSPDGRCKTFDKTANGYVKGEGVGAVLLKPLSKAKADGDHIYGLIKGSAVSHGGKAQSLTAPNALAQSQLLQKAYKQANIDPETITYIETHGTGTELGDPVEIEGLKLAFSSVNKKAYCGLGSVKTNIGHLEPASGMASIIKVLLAMQHKTIPPNLHFHELNPYIDIADSPFYIIDKLQPWKRMKDHDGNEMPYRAGVSSFGLGGTIAHVLIEEAPEILTPPIEPSRPYYLMLFSSKQDQSLKQKFIDLHDWLAKHSSDTNLASLSFTLAAGRTHFDVRCALIVSSFAELKESLHQLINGEIPNDCKVQSTSNGYFSSAACAQLHQSVVEILTNRANTLTPDSYQEKLGLLADLYLQKYPVDWNALYTEDEKKRVASLPPYPFIKANYWFDTESNENHAVIEENDTETTKNFALHYLQKIVAEKVNLLPEQISIDTTYEVYGIDSLLGMEIMTRLEKDFGALPKTLLYEKNHLRELALYLEKNHFVSLQKLVTATIENLPLRASIESEAIQNASLIASDTLIGGEQLHENQDIAIIGLSGIYPMANNIDALWENLRTGRDCITEIPPDRWNYRDYPVAINAENKYYKYGGFIEDIDKFDPLFFNISPHDATLMDPQERLFMQCAWTTLEDAGYTREKLQRVANNQVGVFVGATYNFYPLFLAEEWRKGNQLPLDIQMFSIANRTSYFLNLNGPSYVVDTACSSSLSALHLAYESLVKGECVMAIAGGVNLSLHPYKYHFLASYGFLSENGQCASFGAGGTGYVPSEGVGSVLLKPLSQALKDHDRIYGVIKGSAMNHGGKTAGYTVPNPHAHADLIKNALKNADIDASTISYIEAHGTGTALGDPIEISGLTSAFEDYTSKKQFCSIGSIKSNIGHLEAAAGISQLTKVLLQMRYKKLVPSLHAEKLNPYIDFTQTPFFVQQELKDWESIDHHPRRAGISSFGAGGTNVHMIVEEYVGAPDISLTKNEIDLPFILLLSAKNAERLGVYANDTRDFLVNEGKTFSDDHLRHAWLLKVCCTSQVGRESMTARLAIMATQYEELIEKLTAYLTSQETQATGMWLNHSVQQNIITDIAEETLITLRQKNAYAQLAELWTNGTQIPWETLYSGEKPECVFLPTYPFIKRRCWVSTESDSAISSALDTVSSITNDNNNATENNLVLASAAALTTPPTTQENPEKVTALIIEVLAKSLDLNTEEIDPDAGFQTYGLDSMTGIHFISELSKKVIGTLSPMDLYRYSTVNRLAQYVIKTCQLTTPDAFHQEPVFVVDDIPVGLQDANLGAELTRDLNDNDLLTEISHFGDKEVEALIEEAWEETKE